MMNHQGGLGRFHSYANIQNEVNQHESIFGASGFLSSSSSHTGSNQRFPHRLSGPNFLPHNLDLNAEYVGNDHYTNQNMSVGLCLHPFTPNGSEDQSDSNSSDSMAIDSGGFGHVVEEQGVDSSSVAVMCLLCNRRSSERGCREFLIGESSSTAEQAVNLIPRAATSLVNGNNSLNISAPYTGHPTQLQQFEAGIGHLGTVRPVSYGLQLSEAPRHGLANSSPLSFEAAIGHGTIRPVSERQHFSCARQIRNFQNNIHLQTAANPQAFVRRSMLSMGLAPLFCQYDRHLPFNSPAQTTVGRIPLVHPSVHVPNFHETLLASPWNNNMGPRRGPPSFLPVYPEGETVEPFHNPGNIPRKVMLRPQTGRGIWAHNAANLSSANGTPNFVGNFPYAAQHGSISGVHPSNAPTWVPGFNLCEQHMQMSAGVGNHSAAAPTGFPGQSSYCPLDLDPSAVSREIDFSIGFGSARSQNRHRTESRSENHSGGTPEPRFASWSPEARSSLMTEVRNALEHLRNGGSLPLEVINALEHLRNGGSLQLEENWISESGLREEVIMVHLRQEKFQSITVRTPENDESCCVCQEHYVDGKDIGVLGCRHRFHFNCIKQWLLLKNTCPICIRTALAVIDHD